jgi:hypothetical protein
VMNDVVLSCVVAIKSSVTNVEEKERRREREEGKQGRYFPVPLSVPERWVHGGERAIEGTSWRSRTSGIIKSNTT